MIDGESVMKFSDVKMLPMSEPYINGTQAILDFGTHQLSIVKHDHSYGGKQGKFEIGVFEGNDMVEMPGITVPGDTVKGFLADYEVDAIILKMAAATGTDPVQV